MTILPVLIRQENGVRPAEDQQTSTETNKSTLVVTTQTKENGVSQPKSAFYRIPRPKTSITKPTLVRSLPNFARRQENGDANDDIIPNGSKPPSQRPATSHVTSRSRHDVIGNGNTNMSVSELPPIGKRPGSGTTSKLSSRGSSKEFVKGSVLKHERKSLISVDNLSNDNGRFSKRSLGSEESSAWSKDKDSSSNVNSTTDDKPGSNRGSLQSNSISQGPNKLSTLFETNGASPTSPSSPVPHNENHYPTYPSPRISRPNGRASSHERRLTPSRRTASMKSLISDKSLQSKSTAGVSLYRKGSELDVNGSVSGKATARSNLGRRTPSMPSMTQNTSNGGDQTVSNSRRGSVSTNRVSQTRSTHTASSQRVKIRPRPNAKSKSNNLKNEEDEGDCDAEKEKRIWEWLAGIVGAERPPSPIIFDDEPVQTDTAIHIVYDGDEEQI